MSVKYFKMSGKYQKLIEISVERLCRSIIWTSLVIKLYITTFGKYFDTWTSRLGNNDEGREMEGWLSRT